MAAYCSDFGRKTVTFRFSAPSFADLGATYAVHLRRIGKPVVDFLFMLILLFSLDVIAEAVRRYERMSLGNRCYWMGWISFGQNLR